ncbi:MAG: DUF2892 domain-containing protein [Mariprofundales bacterium]
MKHNVGSIDKIIRIVVGIALLSLFFLLEGNLRWISVLGIVAIGTALINFCPLYAILGMNTCKDCSQEE